MQQRLKQPPRTARAEIVAAEFFEQFLVAVDGPVTALDARLGRIALAALRGDLESSRDR